MSLIYIVTAAASLALCLFANPIGRALGVIDRPDGGRKLHARPTPLIGGIAVVLPWLAVFIVELVSGTFPMSFLPLALAIAVMLALGFVDDRGHVLALVRLMVSFAACLVAVVPEPKLVVEHLTLASIEQMLYLPYVIAIAFTLICTVGLQNALNMADGKNGLAIGILIVWALVLWQYSPNETKTLLAALCIGLFIILFFNLKGSLFLGDAGTYSLSIGIGLLAIYCYNNSVRPMPAEALILLFMIPVLDCLRVMTRRLRAGRSPFSPDRDHLHHYFLRWFSWRRGLLIYLAFIAVPNAIAVLYPETVSTMVMLTVVVYVMLVFSLGREPAPETRSTA